MLKHYLEHPDELLKDKTEWPSFRDRRDYHQCSPEEWKDIALNLARLGIVTFLPEEEIFHVGGQPVLHRCMGISTGDSFTKDVDVLNLVMDFSTTNGLLRTILADVRALPYPAKWSAVEVRNDIVISDSVNDVNSFCYCFALEPAWQKFLALSGYLAGNEVLEIAPHLANKGRVYACAKVLPIGLRSISGLLQLAPTRGSDPLRPSTAL